MSRYLSQLLARSAGNATVAKPRFASRFEPREVAPTTDRSFPPRTLPQDETEDFQGRKKLSPESPFNRESESAAAAGPAPSTCETETAQARTLPPNDPTNGRRNERDALGSNEGPDLSEIGLLENADRATLKESGLPQGDHSRAIASGASLNSENDPSQQAAPSSSRPENPPASVLQRTPDSAAHATVLPEILADSAPPILSTPAPSLLPATALIPSIATTRQLPEPQSVLSPRTSEPDVHITIGRVEVRATISDKPKPRIKADSPVVGLDEYLRKRQDGART
jgi:hypothetical protein